MARLGARTRPDRARTPRPKPPEERGPKSIAITGADGPVVLGKLPGGFEVRLQPARRIGARGAWWQVDSL